MENENTQDIENISSQEDNTDIESNETNQSENEPTNPLARDFEDEARRNPQKIPSNMKIKFMVNGKEIPINQINQPIAQKSNQPQIQKQIIPQVSNEQSKKLAKLPRKEPKTKMKRLSGKLVYELQVPGVDNLQDIIINKLENSIEIKALSKDKIYSKTININLPILKYSLNHGNLVLELKTK